MKSRKSGEKAVKAGTVEDLTPSSMNPRKISDRRAAELAKSMREFGDLSGIVFNVRTGRLIGGHQRIKNLDPSWKITKRQAKDNVGTVAVGSISTPWGEWSYREVDWAEKKELTANIAANNQGGEFDLPKLKLVLPNTDLSLTGFNSEELEKLIRQEEAERPELEFSEELLLEHNYVVLYFENPFDWQVALEKFGLKKVKDLIPRKAQPTGIGRVLSGKDWLPRIKGV